MIAQMMKIAGVKTPEALLKKFPTEEAFMAKCGGQFRKAQLGMQLKKAQQGWNGIPAGAMNYGQPIMGPANQYNFSNAQTPIYGNNFQIDTMGGFANPASFQNPSINFNAYNPQGDQANTSMAKGIFEGAHSVPDSPFGGGGPGIGEVFDLAQGVGDSISGWRAEGNKKKEKKQEDRLTKLNLKAINTLDVDTPRQNSEAMAERYNTFMQPRTGEELFPIQGVGTNVLAKNGIHIKPENKGKFTSWASSHNMGVQEAASHVMAHKENYSPTIVKRANFARNASKWHHGQDGTQVYSDTDQYETYNPNRQGEIQNTYAPEYTLYDDLDYDNAQYGGAFGNIGNQFKQGWGGGVSGIMDAGGGQFANNLVNKAFKGNAGQVTGQTVGKALKMIPGVGPVVSALAEPVLGAVGGFLDDKFGPAGDIKKYQSSIDRTMDKTQGAVFGRNINYANRSFKQDGGIVGIQQQQEEEETPLDEEVTSLWGGQVAPFSRNFALPEGGVTLKTIGDMHTGSKVPGESGIGLIVGKDKIEAEGNEFLTKTFNKDGEVVTSIAGNMEIPKHLFDELGFMNPKGHKYKNQFKLLSEKENKANQTVSKNLLALSDLDVLTSFDKLKQNSYQANKLGGEQTLKGIAETKTKLMQEQQDTLAFAEENGLDAPALSKGKIKAKTDVFTPSTKTAKNGGELSMYDDQEFTVAQNSKLDKISKKEYDARIAAGWTKIPGTNRITNKGITKPGEKTSTATAEARKDIPKQSKNPYGTYGNVDEKLFNETKENNKWYNWERFDPSNPAHVLDFQKKFNAKAKEIGSDAHIEKDSKFGDQTQTAKLLINEAQTPGATNNQYAEVDPETGEIIAEATPERNFLFDAVNATLPMWRPTDQEPFDNRRLSGEMFALSHNQVEPVWAKGYRPELRVPYDISLQDQLNAITSQTRAGQRLVGYNPAAQAVMGSAAYDASSKILGDQFRQNQAFRDQVYSGNIAALNDAQLKNIQTYDTQENRASLARSNTKEAAQLALNSMTEKQERHNLMNKNLGIAENLYNYRYTDKGRAQNWNPLAQFDVKRGDTTTNNDILKNYSLEDLEEMQYMKKKQEKAEKQANKAVTQNGGSVSKPLTKMSLVRALKLY